MELHYGKWFLGVTWGGPDKDWYWFYLFNLLPKKLRHFGIEKINYDGLPITTITFWYFNIVWRI